MAEPIARQALATGGNPAELARALADRLAGPKLQIAFVFADHRLDAAVFAALQHTLAAPVVGCTTVGVLGPGAPPGRAPAAVGLGLYGDWLRVGIGIAPELSRAGLARGREAVHRAAVALGTTADALDPGRHVAITLLDGTSLAAEAFCIGSAASAPKIRFIGGGASTELVLGARARAHRAHVWAHGEVLYDAGVVIVLDSDQPFSVVTSSHLVPTEITTVVTAASGRVIEELDGRPAGTRLRRLIARIGDVLDEPNPAHAFARYIDGVPYVRSLCEVVGERLTLASPVEPGHVLRVMRPGDMIRMTTRDLATAADRVGGAMAALLAFSCMARHTEAALRSTERELAAAFGAYPTVGLQTLSEQSGMLLLNHTLMGLAIGAIKS